MANSAVSEISEIINKVDITDKKRELTDKALKKIDEQVGDFTNLSS